MPGRDVPVGDEFIPHLGPTCLVLGSGTFVHGKDIHYVANKR
jgi:hypothetical protein